jgi:hypothetical protein
LRDHHGRVSDQNESDGKHRCKEAFQHFRIPINPSFRTARSSNAADLVGSKSS